MRETLCEQLVARGPWPELWPKVCVRRLRLVLRHTGMSADALSKEGAYRSRAVGQTEAERTGTERKASTQIDVGTSGDSAKATQHEFDLGGIDGHANSGQLKQFAKEIAKKSGKNVARDTDDHGFGQHESQPSKCRIDQTEVDCGRNALRTFAR